MAWARFKILAVAVAAVLLVIGIATIVTTSPDRLSNQRRLRLPMGNRTPAISLGQQHGLVLASDGSLWSWGSEFAGWPVLGLGKLNAQTRLCRIGDETNWISISAGAVHNVAIKTDGTLWTWGTDLSVQYALGPVDRRKVSAHTPVPGASGHDWKEAVAGGIHTLALKRDGTLWAWGNNWAGSLGTGSTSNSPIPL